MVVHGWAVNNLFAAEKRPAGPTSPVHSMVQQYCADCHDCEVKKVGLDLDSFSFEDVTQHLDVWERVVRKLCARQMLPMGKAWSEERIYEEVVF